MADRSDNQAAGACWAFGPPDGEVVVRNAEALLAHLPVFLSGWPFRRIGGDAEPTAAIAIAEPGEGRFILRGPDGIETAFDNAFEAASALADALVSACIARRDDLVCVRAGGVRVGSGLVVLLGTARAGKSSVALQMAAAGYRLFGDDRLALRSRPAAPAAALCLGLTPRIPLPLPADCGPRLAEYVETFTEMRDDTLAYLKLWEGEAAGFMEESPLAALVVLERRESGPCRVEPAAMPDIRDALVGGGPSPERDTGAVALLGGAAAGIPGYRVRFSSSREAASALLAALRDAG